MMQKYNSLKDIKDESIVPSPLSREQLIELLQIAASAHFFRNPRAVAAVGVRLVQAIPGMTDPYPEEGLVRDRMNELEAQFNVHYSKGAHPQNVRRFWKLIS